MNTEQQENISFDVYVFTDDVTLAGGGNVFRADLYINPVRASKGDTLLRVLQDKGVKNFCVIRGCDIT